jgi:HEAT repeat protein
MSGQKSLDDQLAEITRLAGAGSTPEGQEVLRGFLRSRNNLVAARAADVVRDWSAEDLVPELLELWERSLIDPVKRDKACHAKLAVVQALDAASYDDYDVFLRGACHRQLEPSYGPPVDTAVELRAVCAGILASIGYPEIRVILADLLMDPEPGARKAAAEIATGLGGEAGELLLRMRVLAGDDHTENYGTYFRGLLELSPDQSLSLVESHTRHENPAVVEEAVLALGESRLPEAFPILKDLFDTTILAEERRGIVLGIALLRSDESVDFLEEIVVEGDAASARHVVEALGIYRGTPEVVDRFRVAVVGRGDAGLADLLERVAGG